MDFVDIARGVVARPGIADWTGRQQEELAPYDEAICIPERKEVGPSKKRATKKGRSQWRT
jgi:hypothetical protein